jgi:hypothetical protein
VDAHYSLSAVISQHNAWIKHFDFSANSVYLQVTYMLKRKDHDDDDDDEEEEEDNDDDADDNDDDSDSLVV